MQKYVVDSRSLSPIAELPAAPVYLIDLASAPRNPEELKLPGCPVIGFGDANHPLATQMDALILEPASLETCVARVQGNPMAAAITVQLLRQLPHQSLEQGLWSESLAYAVLQGSAEHRRWLAAQPAPHATKDGAVRLQRENARLTITLDRAEAGNAIDRAIRDALREALALAALDETIEIVRLRGEGKTFSLGADLAEFGTTNDPASAHEIRLRSLPAWEAIRCAEKLEAHIDGACVGASLELAAFARRVTATPRSWFQLPELSMGILPGAGGCVSLTHRIGRQRTAWLVLTGKRVSAREALALGLIDAIVEDEPA